MIYIFFNNVGYTNEREVKKISITINKISCELFRLIVISNKFEISTIFIRHFLPNLLVLVVYFSFRMVNYALVYVHAFISNSEDFPPPLSFFNC